MAVSPAYGFRIDSAREGSAGRVSVFGELDAATAPELSNSLLDMTSEGITEVVVDFSGLEFIDSSGLTVLVAGHKRLQAAGGQLVIEAPPASARRVFDICGLDRVLTIR